MLDPVPQQAAEVRAEAVEEAQHGSVRNVRPRADHAVEERDRLAHARERRELAVGDEPVERCAGEQLRGGARSSLVTDAEAHVVEERAEQGDRPEEIRADRPARVPPRCPAVG